MFYEIFNKGNNDINKIIIITMNKIKVGLLVAEFFSNDIPICPSKGGYGMLARHYISKYVPTDDIEIDVIIANNDKPVIHIEKVDNTNLIYLPNIASCGNKLEFTLNRLMGVPTKIKRSIVDSYDIFLSIEFQGIAREVLLNTSRNQKLIYWAQDPRPQSDWDELDTMSMHKQVGCRPDKNNSKLLNKLYKENRLVPITQGRYLVSKAIDLYDLPSSFEAQFVPNPIDIPKLDQEEIVNKKNYIVSLGRIDSVKRTWIIAEVAKLLPEYEFYFLGQIHEEAMKEIMKPYLNLTNCHFVGHLEGSEKDKLLRQSKILINSSIHEAVPISFLEAMSYGMLLVSNRNPDDLTSKFGINVSQVNGNGFDSVPEFVQAIKKIINNEQSRILIANEARQYIEKYHNINSFIVNIRTIIRNNV